MSIYLYDKILGSSKQARGYLIVELRMLQKSLNMNHLLEIVLVYNLAIFSEGRNEAYSESFLRHYSIKTLKFKKKSCTISE